MPSRTRLPRRPQSLPSLASFPAAILAAATSLATLTACGAKVQDLLTSTPDGSQDAAVDSGISVPADAGCPPNAHCAPVDAAPIQADSATGTLCGFTHGQCPSDSWCDLEPFSGTCVAIPEANGVCRKKPSTCPVLNSKCDVRCGCDLKFYCSECEANRAGVGLVRGAACGSKPCGTIAGLTCAADEWCDYEDATGHFNCQNADQGGICVKRPTSCPPTGGGICACPNGGVGKVYTNACEAHRAGDNVATSSAPCGG